MKNIDKYNANAVLSALLKFCDVKDIATAMAEEISDKYGLPMDVYKIKSDGFILRKKKDMGITYDAPYKATKDVIKRLIHEYDGVIDYISDNYDVEYSDNMVNIDFVQYVFTINVRGRTIFVEIDSLN